MSQGTCIIEGCGRLVRCKQLCKSHYERELLRVTARLCQVDGCNKSARLGSECAMHGHRRRRRGSYDLPPKPPKPQCSVEGCDNVSRTVGLCVNHYERRRARGTTDDYVAKLITRHSAGYVKLKRAGHPVAESSGWVYEHRMVLFDAIGPGSHPCHHCGETVTWGVDLEADHLDYDRANNDQANLVQSCHPCNTRRARHRNQYSAPIDTTKDFAA